MRVFILPSKGQNGWRDQSGDKWAMIMPIHVNGMDGCSGGVGKGPPFRKKQLIKHNISRQQFYFDEEKAKGVSLIMTVLGQDVLWMYGLKSFYKWVRPYLLIISYGIRCWGLRCCGLLDRAGTHKNVLSQKVISVMIINMFRIDMQSGLY